jgi:hypothetical protein
VFVIVSFRYVAHLEQGVSTVIVLVTTSSLVRKVVGALYFLIMLPLYKVMVIGMATVLCEEMIAGDSEVFELHKPAAQ